MDTTTSVPHEFEPATWNADICGVAVDVWTACGQARDAATHQVSTSTPAEPSDDDLHRWEIEPHPDPSFDTLITNSDREALAHILAAALPAAASTDAEPSISEATNVELVTDLQRELAFYFGQWHGGTDHQLDALYCRENECERIKKLLNVVTGGTMANEKRIREVVEAWATSCFTTPDSPAIKRLIAALTNALDAARAESAAAAFQQCAEICAEQAREASVRMARNESDFKQTGSEAADERAAHYSSKATALREAQKAIEAASPNPDFAQRIRDEVWDEVMRIAKQPINTLGWGSASGAVAQKVIVEELEAARTGGHQ